MTVHIPREASAFCPFYSNGQFQGLYAWNGQASMVLTLFCLNQKIRSAMRPSRQYDEMGFFDKLKSKAQDHIEKVKSNTSKQDFLDLVTDCQKTIAQGGADDVTKYKAAGKLFKGLAQMAAGSYEGASRKLATVHKDPYDIQMAQETKDEMNEILKSRLNARKFIFADPNTIDTMGTFILESMNFIDLVKDETLIPRIENHFNECGVHYESATLHSEIKRFITDKEVTQLLAIRAQIDKYVFIDRMSKAEILSLYEKYTYNIAKHYKYECEYCRMKFERAPTTGTNAPLCEFSPLGHYKGPHKVHSIENDKLWVD